VDQTHARALLAGERARLERLLRGAVRGAEVGPAILLADAPGEAVVLVGGDLDVAADLQGAVRAGRVGESRVARGRDMRFLVFCLVVFSEILTRLSSARKATMVLCG
jgi:hypothetical protein